MDYKTITKDMSVIEKCEYAAWGLLDALAIEDEKQKMVELIKITYDVYQAGFQDGKNNEVKS